MTIARAQESQVDTRFGEDVGQPFPPLCECQLLPLPNLGGPGDLKLLFVQPGSFHSQLGERVIQLQQRLDLGVQHLP